jgi:integrase/recombinase XerD
MEEIKLHQFAEKLELRGYSKRSIKDYPYNMGHFMRYLEEKESVRSLAQVTPKHLTAYHAYLQYAMFRNGRHLATVSVIKRLEAVKLFYKIMFAEGLIKQDFAPLIAMPKRKHGIPRHVPTEKEMSALLDAIAPCDPLSIRDRAMLELLYATGLRSEELRTAAVANLDLNERTLLVTGKGSKDRIVPVGDWVMPYMLEYLAAVRPKLISPRDPSPLLFITKNGRPITFGNLGDIIKRYAKKAGIKTPVTPHSFRHACATHLLKGGADIRYVQELLGHSALTSTQIYTKLDISFLKQAHKKYHPREQAGNDV